MHPRYALYISYSHEKYRLIEVYNTLADAISALQSYAEAHTVSGDTLKLVVRK